MQTYERFNVERVNDMVVLRLRDTHLLDPHTTTELMNEVMDFISLHRPEVITITFEYVKRFSTDVVNALLMIREQIVYYGGRLILCEMRSEIRDVFRLLSLNFEIHETLHEALDASTTV